MNKKTSLKDKLDAGRGVKVVNGGIYKLKDGLWRLDSEGPSSRKNSWITMAQISMEFPEFIDKIADILYGPYTKEMKEYARNILAWLEMWKFVSWKQFDSIIRICESYEAYKASLRGTVQVVKDRGLVSVKAGQVTFTYRGEDDYDWTDQVADNLHHQLFGFYPVFEEEVEEGLVRSYRSDGTRYWSLPSGDENLGDYINFGITFKGLSI